MHKIEQNCRHIAVVGRSISFTCVDEPEHQYSVRQWTKFKPCCPPSLIADRHHSLFGHIYRLSRDTLVSQAPHLSIDAFTSTPPATDWKRPLSTGGRRYGSTHQCRSIRNPGPLAMEIATTLSWSSAAVNECCHTHNPAMGCRVDVAAGLNTQ